MQASQRVQGVYTDHQLRPRPERPRSMYDKHVRMLPLLGIALPFLLTMGGMDENLLGRILVMVATTVVGFGVWAWMSTEMTRPRGHWLAHRHPTLVPVAAIVAVGVVYLAVSAGLSFLVFR